MAQKNRRKISIVNKTHFDTRCIRKIVLMVARNNLNPAEYPNLDVTVGYPKRDYVTASAVVRPSTMTKTAVFTLNIPRDQTHRVKVCLDYCRGHHYGTTGTDFRDWYNRPGKPEHYKYIKKLVLGKAVPKPQKASGSTAAFKKAELAQVKVHEWQDKTKRAMTALKKWGESNSVIMCRQHH